MTPGSLAPGFVRVDYHSARSPHVMIIGVNEVIDTTVDFADFEVKAWDNSHRNLHDMVVELLTETLPRFPASVHFDGYTYFKKPLPEDNPIFLGSAALTLTGSATTPGWDEATQETILMRDTNGALFKLVLLDFASGNDFNKYKTAATIGVDAIVTKLSLVTNGWRSRKEGRPSTFIARTATINDKLRKAYRMT